MSYQPVHSLRRHTDRLLAQAVRAGRGWMAALTLASVAENGLLLLWPAALATAVDTVLGAADPSRPLLVLGAVIFAGLLATVIIEVTEGYGCATSTAALRRRLVGHVLSLGPARPMASGDLTSRVIAAAPKVAKAAPTVVDGVTGVLVAAGALVALALIDLWLIVTLVICVPIGFALVRVFVRRTGELTGTYQEVQGDLAARLVDALDGTRTIRAAGTVDREIARVLAPLPDLAAAGLDLWRVLGRMAGRGALIGPLAGLLTLAVAGHGVSTGRITTGEMLAAAAYVPIALAMLDQLGLLAELATVRAAARRLSGVTALPTPPRGDAPLPPGDGRLELAGVSVRYGGRTLLKRIDLVVPAGSVVAVVGRSGAGKTSLAAVAGRLADPAEGEVLLDGVPLAEIDWIELRRAIVYAFERPELLGTTVADAITYGAEPVTPLGIRQAALDAAADDFIRRRPGGYHAALDAAPMSGGEIQRLGLARALARPSRLLILDDATSSLDTVTEAQISNALAHVALGRTCLVIAHRAATAARSDLVAWLDDGRIRAVAPHSRLWRDPAYRRVFRDEK